MVSRLFHYGLALLFALVATAGIADAQGRGRGGPAGPPARNGGSAARPPAMSAPPASNRPMQGQVSNQIVRTPDRHVIIATPPYYGYYGGYYNGFYNGYGYYDPYPYGPSHSYYPSSPYVANYVEPTYASPSPSPSEVELSYQVDRLTREVERLRQDQAEAALRQSLAPPPPRAPEPPAAPITLVFRDGRRLSIQSYAISRQTLWVIDDRTSMKIDLSELDLPATQQANLGRVLLLPVPAR